MPHIYYMKGVQAALTRLFRWVKRLVIANRNKSFVIAMPVANFKALMETMEILADPTAMKSIRSAKAGKTRYHLLDLNDENFGL